MIHPPENRIWTDNVLSLASTSTHRTNHLKRFLLRHCYTDEAFSPASICRVHCICREFTVYGSIKDRYSVAKLGPWASNTTNMQNVLKLQGLLSSPLLSMITLVDYYSTALWRLHEFRAAATGHSMRRSWQKQHSWLDRGESADKLFAAIEKIQGARSHISDS